MEVHVLSTDFFLLFSSSFNSYGSICYSIKIYLFVTILSRGIIGASTEQKTIPIFSILSIILHYNESLNSTTALLLLLLLLLFNLMSL
jgi:hypothetical protein